MSAIQNRPLDAPFVTIDPETGEGTLAIPMGGLPTGEAASPAFELVLSCPTAGMVFDILPCGVFQARRLRDGSGRVMLWFDRIPSLAGRLLAFEMEMKTTFKGADFVAELVDDDLVVTFKNGARTLYGKKLRTQATGPVNADTTEYWTYPVRHVDASGRELHFQWEDTVAGPRLATVREARRLVLVAEREGTATDHEGVEGLLDSPQRVVLFPGSAEQVTYTLTSMPAPTCRRHTIAVSGPGAAATFYLLESRMIRLRKFEVSTQPSSGAAEDPPPSNHTETMEYEGNRITRHTVQAGAGATPVVKEYAVQSA